MEISASLRRRSDEEVPVHGGPDSGYPGRRGSRIGRGRGLSQTRHQFGYLQPVQEQVPRHASQRAQEGQGTGSGERQAQEDVRRVGLGEHSDQGRAVPKVVTPIAKRAAVEIMVTEHGLSRAKACRTVKLSRSAFYKPTVDRLARDAPVVGALNQVLAKRSRWGFWKCFDLLRAEGRPWNHKRVHRVYCEMRLNLKRKAKKRLTTRERQPLLQTNELNQV
jgi:hypothetical protein